MVAERINHGTWSHPGPWDIHCEMCKVEIRASIDNLKAMILEMIRKDSDAERAVEAI